MIIDIRGTNGSGKSWVVHHLLDTLPTVNILTPYHPRKKRETLGYILTDYDAAVVGQYKRTCGGCDTIKTADKIEARIRVFARTYKKVILEGITVSHTFERYNNLALDLGDDYYFLFLDTTLETCIERVKARRVDRDNEKTFDPRNVVSDYERVLVAKRKLTEAGRKVIALNHLDPIPQVMELLNA